MRAHLASLVDEWQRRGSETAVVAHRGNRRYPTTYGELAHLAGRVSAELRARAIAPGERVVLWGSNSAEWIACFFACLLRGVIAVPLDATGTAEFATRVIRDVSPKLVIGDARLLATLSVEIAPDVPQIALATLSSHLPTEPLFTVSDTVTAHTPFQIVFTSGTTSEPRGIVHTHRNVLVTLEPIEREMQRYLRYERWVHPLRFLHSLPLSHVFGQFMGLWIPPLLGAEIHFSEALEAAHVVDLIRRERISVLIAVPRVLQLLRASLLSRFADLTQQLGDASQIKLAARWWRFRRVHRTLGWKFWAVISGGATLTPEVESFWNRLGFALIQGYGMTETSALVTLNHPFHIQQGAVGKPLPGREVKLTEEGEILVRGEMLAGATWQGSAMRPREGEWLATGDLAEQGASGELRFLGRKGDVIVTGAGLNIHPADLRIRAAPPAPRARLCGSPVRDPTGPEAVAVVLFAGTDAALQLGVDAANRTLAEFQQIRRVLRWPEPVFPYTATGKLLRRQITQWACATISGQISGRSSSPHPPAGSDTLLTLVAEITGEVAPAHRHAEADTLRLSEDLHLDSLGRVQLQTLIEQRLVVETDDDALAAAATLGDLRALVSYQPDTRTTSQPHSARALDSSTSPSNSPAASRPTAPDEFAYPRWPWSWPMQTLRVLFVEALMRPLVSLLAAPQIVRDDVTYPELPLLIVANHVTAYDGALVLYGLPPNLRRHVASAMSGEMLADLHAGRNQGSPILNLLAPGGYWLLTALFNVFPLPRARGFRRSFAHAGQAMDRGFSVLIFPEGTRSRDGEMHSFRHGIGLLAKESGVPVLPVALVGLGALRMAGRGWLRSGRLTIRVGTPIQFSDIADPADIAQQLEDAVRNLLQS